MKSIQSQIGPSCPGNALMTASPPLGVLTDSPSSDAVAVLPPSNTMDSPIRTQGSLDMSPPEKRQSQMGDSGMVAHAQSLLGSNSHTIP